MAAIIIYIGSSSQRMPLLLRGFFVLALTGEDSFTIKGPTGAMPAKEHLEETMLHNHHGFSSGHLVLIFLSMIVRAVKSRLFDQREYDLSQDLSKKRTSLLARFGPTPVFSTLALAQVETGKTQQFPPTAEITQRTCLCKDARQVKGRDHSFSRLGYSRIDLPGLLVELHHDLPRLRLSSLVKMQIVPKLLDTQLEDTPVPIAQSINGRASGIVVEPHKRSLTDPWRLLLHGGLIFLPSGFYDPVGIASVALDESLPPMRQKGSLS